MSWVARTLLRIVSFSDRISGYVVLAWDVQNG